MSHPNLNGGIRTRYWVQYRKSQYRGSTTYKWFFVSKERLDAWRKSHPNNKHYTEIAHA